MHAIYGFFNDNIWGIYNKLERDVVFPWLADGGRNAKGHANLLRAVDTFGVERDRISAASEDLWDRLGLLAKKKSRARRAVERNMNTCNIEVRRVVSDINELLEDTERLHKAEESKEDQRRITSRIVDMLDKPLAKLTIVSFHEALKTTAATRADWRAYEKEVPAPIRLYLWVWRGRYWDPSPLADLDPDVTNSTSKMTK
jgi:hypothetical protein